MENYSFTKNNVQYAVQVDKATGHKISWPENGNTRELQLKAFRPNYISGLITTEWVKSLKDSTGAILQSEVRVFDLSSQAEFDGFYAVTQLPIPAGDMYAKFCLNRIANVELGYGLFGPTGLFVDPNTVTP